MNVVLDTNVLVSALWSADSKPAMIVNAILSGRFTPCYDSRILSEYQSVLRRPKFGFYDWEINALLDPIIKNGLSVIPDPITAYPFPDESDRKFLEVTEYCQAQLITGNIKHFPDLPCVITVADFYSRYV